MKVEDIARICHQANKAICEINNLPVPADWNECEESQRVSMIAGVTFALANPNATPEDQHKRWCEDKRADGWVYGAIKDAAIKQHDCLVPYDQLPASQRIKDVVFRSIVVGCSPFLD